MSDIVERLRDDQPGERQAKREARMELGGLLMEAADEIEKLRAALRGLIEYVEKEQCDHLILRRGTSWTFCDNCGGKWASDEWDFRPPKKELKEVATARAALGEKE